MATLKLENLSKRYSKKVWGAKDINLTVNSEEFIVLLGPSGCGKTTTLRMIAGLEEVTEGKIFIDNKEITFLPPRKRDVSMVFQSYAVWPHMTVFENIAFPLKLRGENKTDIEKKVVNVAKMVKIEEYLRRYPSQLSGGQRQRVALARALVVNPKIFLMDEPLSNLDAKLRVNMRTELKAIHQKTHATSVFVTHDQSEAMSMADRIVIMKDGKIVQIGTPDDVYFKSATTFVAGFIGTPPTNFFEVDITKDGDDTVLKNPGFQIRLKQKDKDILRNYNKSRLILGVRPEDIKIVKKEESILTKELLVVEPQGSFQILSMEVNNHIIKIIANTLIKFHPDDLVSINFDMNRIHLFDIDTGERINA